MQNNLEIGERVRKIREELGMSREKFSEMIDISNVFLGQIERGERLLSIKTLSKIVSYTGCSADYILYGNDSNNKIIFKINKILADCSNITLEYIYNIIINAITFFKSKNIEK